MTKDDILQTIEIFNFVHKGDIKEFLLIAPKHYTTQRAIAELRTKGYNIKYRPLPIFSPPAWHHGIKNKGNYIVFSKDNSNSECGNIADGIIRTIERAILERNK